jgi:sugar (pentulose or hexulose) kinase
MSVMLSAASCLDWAATLTGLGTVPALIAAAEAANDDADPVWFLPYLSGERTPHNNPQAKGVFFGLTHQHGPAELARAVLEGVGYALADGMDVVHACGVKPESITLIGGGARSAYWRQMLADISGQQLDSAPAVTSARRLARRGWRSWRCIKISRFPIYFLSCRWNRLIVLMPSALLVTRLAGKPSARFISSFYR